MKPPPRIHRTPDAALNRVVITTAKGLVDPLTGELNRLGLEVLGATDAGVSVLADMTSVMRMNLMLRTAHRILWRIGEGSAHHPDALYKRLVTMPWEKWIDPNGYLSVTCSGRNIGGHDPRFVALKTKDAIVDRIQETRGARPDSGPDRNRTVVHLHWDRQFFDVYFDTSGEPLTHRGYRLNPYKAPMRETLAAGCLLAAGWKPADALVNPMCGSGTLAIEAALMASRTPPGWFRDNFGFMHLNGFDRAAWDAVRREAGRERLARPHRVSLFASDKDPRAVQAARENTRRAGLEAWIDFTVRDFRDVQPPPPPGLVIFNPEYGERIGDNEELAGVYRAIGDFMKQRARGFTGAVFTGNAEMIKPVGLKPRVKLQMFNGPIECRLLLYDLYDGTKRDRRARDRKPDNE